MRQGEIAGLRWRAVNLGKGVIHVSEAIAQSGEGGTYSKVYSSMRKSTPCYVDNRQFDSDHADLFT